MDVGRGESNVQRVELALAKFWIVIDFDHSEEPVDQLENQESQFELHLAKISCKIEQV